MSLRLLQEDTVKKRPPDLSRIATTAGQAFREAPRTPLEIAASLVAGKPAVKGLRLLKERIPTDIRETFEIAQISPAFAVGEAVTRAPQFKEVTKTPFFQRFTKESYKKILGASPLPDALKTSLQAGIDKMTPEAVTKISQFGGTIAIYGGIKALTNPRIMASFAKLPVSKRTITAFTDPEFLADRVLKGEGMKEVLRYANPKVKETVFNILRKRTGAVRKVTGLLEYKPPTLKERFVRPLVGRAGVAEVPVPKKPFIKPTKAPIPTKAGEGIEPLKQLPLLPIGKKMRVPKTVALPRGEDFLLKGLPKRVGLSPKQRLEQEKKRIQEEQLGFILKGKPKTIPIPKEGMATTSQKRQAHIIAKQKVFITPEGKTTPQYRRLAEGITGKKSMKDMTEVEAGEFIRALETISEPYYKVGKLIPPTIPITKKIVTEDFFKQKFKTPTPLKHLTSQTYYAEKLGVKPLTEPLELAKQNLDLETRALDSAIEQQAKMIDKVGKTTLAQRTRARITNTPTPAVQEMRNLLDTYEEAPDFLPPEKKKIFDWFRNLNKTVLKGENEVRKSLGLEQIKYRKAYVRHIADKTAQELLQGKYPFPEGLKYWADRIVGKTIHNPMAMQRQLADDLEGYFTKDLIYATKAMVRTGLKEIHLSQPLRVFSEQLGALSKDIPQYKALTPDQLNTIKEMSVMPASTKRWLIEYVNQVIKGQQTHLDEAVNKMVTDSGVGVMFNKVLTPFGRTLSKRPITNTFRMVGKGIIHGVMGWIPKQLVRNKFQLFQNLALYSIKANLKGFLPTSVDRNLQELVNKSIFYKSYTGVEETPRDIKNALEKLWMAPYQWTAVTNAGQSMKVAYWDTLKLIRDSRYKGFGWADPKRTYKEPKDFLYPSEKEKLLKEMEFGAGVTQFSYIPMGMPQIFRYKTLTPITRLQSWWMNYFTRFTRESIHRLFKGETSYGAKLPWSRRLGYAKYLLIAGSIFSALGYKRSFLLGVLPTYLSPAAQLALGMYLYVAADTDWEKKKAVKQMQYSWKAFIPGSGAWRNWHDVWTGKKPLKALFFYVEPPKKKKKGLLRLLR